MVATIIDIMKRDIICVSTFYFDLDYPTLTCRLAYAGVEPPPSLSRKLDRDFSIHPFVLANLSVRFPNPRVPNLAGRGTDFRFQSAKLAA